MFNKASRTQLVIWILGSLSNDEGDDNENGKNGVRLDWNKPARSSRFFVHFFTVVAQLRGETS